MLLAQRVEEWWKNDGIEQSDTMTKTIWWTDVFNQDAFSVQVNEKFYPCRYRECRSFLQQRNWNYRRYLKYVGKMVEKESLDSAVVFCIKNTFQVLYVAAVKVRNILSSTDEIIFIILTVLEPTISKRNFGK